MRAAPRPRSLLACALATLALLALAFAAQPARASPCPVDAEVILSLVNAVRAQGARCGQRGDFPPAPPVRWNATLAELAADHAQWLVRIGELRHTGPDGEGLAHRADRIGYRFRSLGENLAHGQRTLPAALNGWVNSETHCATLFGPHYTEAGLACRPAGDGRPLWVLELGRPRDLPAPGAFSPR